MQEKEQKNSIIFTPRTRISFNGFSENVAISGQKLQFFNDKVVKSGATLLVSQAIKQRIFADIKISNFFAPKVYEIKKDSFTMEQIQGRSWLDFFNYSSISEIKEFSDNLITYLFYLRSLNTFNQDIYVKTWNKLESLYKKSNHSGFINFLSKQKDLIAPISFCHGDLTLSNIIFNDKGYYLIDFLDSFVESYWIDIIKLRQDCFYKWCLLYNGIESARISIILNKLNNLLVQHFGDEINSPTFQILEAINILRIEPYISSDKSHIIDKMLVMNPLYAKFNNSTVR